MRLQGLALTGWLSLALLAMSAVVLASAGTDEPGVRMWIRATARSSVVLFLLAFAARPSRQLWRSEPTRFLLKNRRYLGLSFAVSHGLHGVGLLWFAFGHPASYEAEIGASTVVLGGLGYVLTAAMAATSSDAAFRRLGRVRWQALHRTGMWTLFVIFLATFGGALAGSPGWIYALATAGLLAALALRIVAWARARERAQAAA